MRTLVRFLVSLTLVFGLTPSVVAGQESSDDEIEPVTIDILVSLGQDRIVALPSDGPVAVDAGAQPSEPEFQILGASIVGGPIDRFDADGNGSFDSSIDLFTSPDGVVVPIDPIARGVVVPFGPDGTVILPADDAFFSAWLILITLELSKPIVEVDGETEVAICTQRSDLMAVDEVPGINIPCGAFNTTTALVSGVDVPLRSVFTQTSAASGVRNLFGSPHIVATSTADDRHFVSFAIENPAQEFTAIASNGRPGELPTFWFETTALDVEVTEITDADMVATAEAIRLQREADRFADSLVEEDAEPAEETTAEDIDEGTTTGDSGDPADADVGTQGDPDGETAAESAPAAEDESETSSGPIEVAVDINEPEGDAGDGFSWTPVLVGVAVVGAVTFFYFMWVRSKDDEERAPVVRNDLLLDPQYAENPEATVAYLRRIGANARAGGAEVVDGGVVVQPSDFFGEADPTGRMVPDRLRQLVVDSLEAHEVHDELDDAVTSGLASWGGPLFVNMQLGRPAEDLRGGSLLIDEETGKVYRRVLLVDGAELGDPISMTDDPRVL